MEIFIIHDGQQTGPFTPDAVQAMLGEGRVRSQDMGWRKGLAAWLPLSEVLKPERSAEISATPAEANGANGSPPQKTPATGKQKALLKFLGAEFSGEVGKEKAALAISDAMENPKLQAKFRKWNDEKLRLHPDVFQDEIDFRRANRVARYLELCHTDGAEVVKDVTKAHVQVLVESLDKRYPQWEAEPHAALWDYLFPAIVEHFPQLVLPQWNGRLRLGGTSKVAAVAAAAAGVPVGRQTSGVLQPPPAPPGVFTAAARGLIYGVLALGVIVGGNYAWKQTHPAAPKPAPQPTPVVSAPAKTDAPAEAPIPAPPAEEKPAVVAAVPEIPPLPVPEKTPDIPPPPPAETNLPPVPPVPMAENKPPPVEEKPAAPVAPVAENKPAMAEEKPAIPPAPAPPAAPRTTVNLIQGIGVALPNGNVTLPAGTQMRFLALDGANVRVSWNNNVFDVPAIATDIGKDPAPATPAIAPAPPPPAVPVAPMKKPAAKPGDDL